MDRAGLPDKMTRTFYDVLEVSEDASQEEITEAYREKVKETHPDVSEADDAAEEFRAVTRAEEVLGEPAEREKYDELGHEAYLSRVEGGNAAGAEQSPWTTGSRRDRSHDAGFDFDPSEGWTAGDGAAAGAASTEAGSAGGTTAGGGSAGGTSASDASTGGFKDASASAGFGASANRQSAGNATHGEQQGRWSADGYAGGTGDTSGDSTYSVHDWDEDTGEPGTVTIRVSQEMVVVAVSMFFLYPILVWASITPSFPILFNLPVAALTLLAVGYMLTVPKMAISVFGAWSVAAPVGVVALTDWGMSLSMLSIGVCWVPFAYAVTVAYFTRPG